MPSLSRQLQEVREAVIGRDRYLDLALALRRDKTQETILWAGGRWDQLERQFVDIEPERVAIVDLEESQVPFARWFAEFLADYRDGYPREVSLALAAGDRRGGKTFDAYYCQIAALIDVPMLGDKTPSIGWTISRTYRERDELDQLMLQRIPESFYRHQKAPEHRFTLAHGSYLRNLSADEPDSLKQGRVDFLLYNEPQKMSPRAIKNGLYGTSDRGGLTVLASNPPSPGEAEWLIDLKEGIEEDPDIKLIARFFNFDSRLNTKIDQPARRRAAMLARKIDPDGAEADAEGRWVRWGDLAYPAWNHRPFERGGLVAPLPVIGPDITTKLTRQILGRAFEWVIGGDFQRRPEAAVILKVFDSKDGPIYWFARDIGVKGTEIELSGEVLGFAVGDDPLPAFDMDSAAWIADCSGSFQGAERIPGRTSFMLLREQGWRSVEPAEVIKLPGKSDHPKNPDVMQRLGLMQRLMGARRIRVDPKCEWLIEAFTKCQLRKTDYGRRVPKGQWAHVTDAACYPVWRLEPKPNVRTPPSRDGIKAINVRPQGPRIL